MVQLFFAGVISGVAVGALYGLLGFAIVMLFKSTGVANFAQGAIGTFAAFVVYELCVQAGLDKWIALAIGIPVAALTGIVLYLLALRPNDDADRLNLTIRTLGVSLLVVAIINEEWSAGQPFTFPSVLSGRAAFTLADTAVSWLTIGTVVIAAVLAAGFVWFFRRTNLGLMFLGLADRGDIAALLGVRTRRLTAIAWGIAALLSLVAAVLVAPRSLLSSDMMDFYLLYAFTSAVIGGLSSLWGGFVGGAVVGILSSLVTIYANPDVATISVFGLLLLVLLVRPSGIFGDRSLVERL